MGPLLRQPAGQNRGTFAAIETGLGFGQKSRSIKDLERIQARDPWSSGPAMRLNWVLLPREPGSASFYGVYARPAPGPGDSRQDGDHLTSWQALQRLSPDGPGRPSI